MPDDEKDAQIESLKRELAAALQERGVALKAQIVAEESARFVKAENEQLQKEVRLALARIEELRSGN